jgi:hypothetical protein
MIPAPGTERLKPQSGIGWLPIKETRKLNSTLATCFSSVKAFPREDFIQAHMWCDIAGASGNSLAAKMTSARIAEAQRLARG